MRATLIAGAVATMTAGAAFAVAGDSDAKYFSIVLTLSIALLALPSLPVFAALIRLRISHAAVHRPFRVPGGRLGACAASALATGWCALALTAIPWPGLGAPHSDAYLPAGFAGDRTGFVVVERAPIAAVLVGALAFAGLGRRGERRRRDRRGVDGEIEAACRRPDGWPGNRASLAFGRRWQRHACSRRCG